MIKKSCGYTFLELMVTVSILAIGIVGVYKVLLASIDYQTQLSCRLYAANLIEHEIALIENQLRATGQFPIQENGKVIEAFLDRRNIDFRLSLLPAGVENQIVGLIPVEVVLSWTDRGRTINLKRALYFVSLNMKLPIDARSSL